MLYDRDFRVLTPQEESQWLKAKQYAAKRKEFTADQLFRYHDLMPDAVYHFESLFPNNYLNTDELKNHGLLDSINAKFVSLLDTEPSERAVLNFINNNRYYLIIGSILKSSYFFGHHDAYAFREFELPPNFVADYLLVGKNSGGYQFVFVELESPVGSIVNADGSFGTTIRKGLKQIEDWDAWIDSNFSHLKLLFQKYMGSIAQLPDEFISLDKTRIHYAVVAGRRRDFKEKTYRLQRKLKKERNITLLHYDNLVDTIEMFKRSYGY